MPGLLDALQGMGSNPLIGMGAGLLGASGYSPYPVSMGQAMGQGLLGMQRASQVGTQQQMAREKMDMMRQERERKATAAAQAIKDRQRQQAAMVDAMIARGMDPSQASNLAQAGVGAQYLGPPSTPDPTSLERNLQAAGLQPGTPEYSQAMMSVLRKPTVAMMSEAKPVGTGAPDWRMPDGGQPNPGMSVRDVIAAGGQPVSKGEQAAESASLKLERQQQDSQRKLTEAIAKYDQAYETWRANPTPVNKRRVDEESAAVALKRQDLLNLGRELSGPMQRQLQPPGVMGRMAEEVGGQMVRGLLGPTPAAVNPAAPAAPLRGETPKPSGLSEEEWQEYLRYEMGN